MAQLIVRKLPEKIVDRLKRRAAEHGVSMEEEHRRLLRDILDPQKKPKPKLSFHEYLIAPPYVDIDLMDYIPKRDKRHRKVNLT